MRKLILLLCIAALSGCATTTSSEIYTADGRLGRSIYCSGTTWGPCYEKAGETCGTKGYEVLEKSGDQGGANPNFIKRSIIIQCR